MSTYLIIGGNSGIGKAITKELSDRGHSYITMSRSSYGENHPAHLEHFIYDVTSQNSPPEISQELDGIVYCPGSINLKPFKSLKIEDFRNDLEINYLGMIRILQHYVKSLSKGSSIVLFGTVAVGNGMPFHTSISGAKGAVEGFGKSLAAELAPKIRVNMVSPSLTDTPMAEKLLKSDKQIEASNERHPLKRFGKPEDIAKMAAFLLTDDSSWISGQVFHVDGGLSTLKIL